ncbi:MAG: hypothetical protein HC802_14405, partial [Caldilineaceae bacterium]|nr:hypothetical protein [Caldilineaceae bacterium]
VVSANQPVAVSLEWGASGVQDQPNLLDDLGVTLRLQDEAGRTWVSRDYAPLGGLGVSGSGDHFVEQAGLIAPMGLPPGEYAVMVGLVDEASGNLLPRLDDPGDLVKAGLLTIDAPEQAYPAVRLPIEHPLPEPAPVDGLLLLGHAGATHAKQTGAKQAILAGSEVRLMLFWQAVQTPPLRHIYVDLLDQAGNRVAGYEGWPLAEYPTDRWRPGALAQTPIDFFLPATAPSGTYRLSAGLFNPADSRRGPATELGKVNVVQRPLSNQPPSPENRLENPFQFAAHAELIGYDLERTGETGLDLTLYWHVLQPLLPPHHIFVHLNDRAGATVAQSDGPPTTDDGAAPTGSWRADEYLATHHRIELPSDRQALPLVMIAGLYAPENRTRLPVTVDGEAAGDSAALGIVE